MKKTLKYGCFGILGIVLILLISFLILYKQAFGPIEEVVKIKQEIGGELICNSTYSADIQSWYYFVDYKYKNEDDVIIEIGKGEYFNREWKKDEQLIKIGEWLFLQTGGEFKTDKLLIGTDNTSNWRTFEISPKSIEKDSLWKSKNIYIIKAGTPSEAFIKVIRGDRIEVDYLFRTGENYEDQETRRITYVVDEEKGIPVMMKIELKNKNER